MFKVLAAICILGAGYLFFIDGSRQTPNFIKSEGSKSSGDSNKSINYRLQKAEQKQKLKEMRLKNSFDDDVFDITPIVMCFQAM